MASNFQNPRLAALPCERMRGCVFADDFVTLTRIADNHGTASGTGQTADCGLTTTAAGYYYFNKITSIDTATIIIRFATTTTYTGTTKHYLINTAYGETLDDGFAVWVDATGVKANHADGAGTSGTECSYPCTYNDGEIHTVVYTIDLTANKHWLYVDTLASEVEAASTAATLPGTTRAVIVNRNFVGTTYRPRIYKTVLTDAEIELYLDDAITDFWEDNAIAVYRMDVWGHDNAGKKIWDRTLNLDDLLLADGSTTAAMPGYGGSYNAGYLFDYVDDYVSSLPTLPDEYTVSAVLSTPEALYPYIRQDYDTSLTTLLTTSAGYWGYVHNLVIFNKELSQIEKYHAEYTQLYYKWRMHAYGAYHRLITEGVCELCVFLDADYWVYRDYSDNNLAGYGNSITRGGSSGCTFGAATSAVIFPKHPDALTDEITISVYGDFTTAGASGRLTYKTPNYCYDLMTDGNNIKLGFSNPGGSSDIAHTFANNQHIAVTYRNGFKPRFYVDGLYIGLGSAFIDDVSDTETNLYIGNNATLTDVTPYVLRQVSVYNKALTDREILALYEEAQHLNGVAMETGTRTEVRQVFTATAVDEDVDPGGPFQLIDVAMIWNTAPTTSQYVLITSINGDGDDVWEYRYDPSTSTDTVHVFRFDKRFADGRTIAIDYTNTDGRTITVLTTYQLDESVT